MKNIISLSFMIFLIVIFNSCGSEKSDKAKNEILQIGLTFANGYSGRSSITISKDSTIFILNRESEQHEFDTLTSSELWKNINSLSDLNLINIQKSGKSNQERDGTDTIFFMLTKTNSYSITNGKIFEEQKNLMSLLMTQFETCNKIAKSK